MTDLQAQSVPRKPLRVLVCGGRGWGEVPDDCPPNRLAEYTAKAQREKYAVWHALDELAEVGEEQEAWLGLQPLIVIHGKCPTGADRHAEEWAVVSWHRWEEYPTDWKTHGRAAGPIRNQRMIDDGKPDIALVFPGGRGTADMTRRASAAGIKVKVMGAA